MGGVAAGPTSRLQALGTSLRWPRPERRHRSYCGAFLRSRPKLTAARSWLATRLDGVPQTLKARLQDALARDSDEGLPADVFRRVALALIGELRGDRSRDDAFTLLTADALMTYACEAVSEQSPERLAELL